MSDDLAHRIAKDYEGKELGGYTIRDLHAKGGTSAILVGERDGERAAIKIYAQTLFNELGDELERINRQVEKRHFQHPNLVKTYGSGYCEEHNYHYLIMEFVSDKTVTERVKELTFDQMRSIIQQAAKAALFMHEKMQQVHRDIKPDNLAVRDVDNHVTLLDLGLVRPVIGESATDQGSRHIKGTKEYAPPELLDNQVTLDNDGWIAVSYYQLGATLFEMLTGEKPFLEYQSDDELFHAIRTVPLTIDSTEAPSDLVKLALDCLSKDPSQRLELVDWNRFLNAPSPETQLEELDSMISLLETSSTSTSSFPDEEQEKQLLKNVIADLSINVELLIRAIVSSKTRLFPGYRITRREDLEENEKSFVFVLETNFSEHGISLHAHSVIATEVTDARSRSCICRVFTLTAPPNAPLEIGTFRTAYQGAFVPAECRARLENEMARDLKTLLEKEHE